MAVIKFVVEDRDTIFRSERGIHLRTEVTVSPPSEDYPQGHVALEQLTIGSDGRIMQSVGIATFSPQAFEQLSELYKDHTRRTK